MKEVLIRPMKEEDLTEVAEIEKEAITPPWSRQAFQESLALPHVCMLTAVLDGTVVGYLVCYQSFEEGEITNVAVKRELRGQRIAGRLLETLFSIGTKRGIEHYLLEVRAGNEAAIWTYKKAGFEAAGLRKNFYKQPVEDAVIMTRG